MPDDQVTRAADRRRLNQAQGRNMAQFKVGVAVAALVASFGSAGAGGIRAGGPAQENKNGQTMPYSGPASAYGTQGRIEEAYFNMVNSKGGVNGRKVIMISLDDAYSPPKTVEQTRKLVEQEEVLAIIGTIGTPTNSATQKY